MERLVVKRARNHTLSKSRFTAGLQCPKRLYLMCHSPRLADPVSRAQQALFDSGARVGELARRRFPGGTLIAESHLQHAKAERATARAMRDPRVPALYEAAFTFDGIRIRVDILERVGSDTFDLVEVKSATRVKEEHPYDVGVQLHVLRGLGIAVRRAGLLHLNRSYVYLGGGEYDLDKLFVFQDLREIIEEILPSIEEDLDGMREVLALAGPPDIEVGSRCKSPYPCPFYLHCHAGEPEHPIHELYRANDVLLSRLRERGIRDIREIPGDFEGLSAIQARMRRCVISNRPKIEPAISRKLRSLRPPIHFLDFETFNPALPRFPATRPYDVIPFQWSNHILEGNGEIRHLEHLDGGDTDPRPSFTRSLLEATEGAGPIVTYSGFENARLRDLAEVFPDLAPAIKARSARIVDLLPLVRRHCYHPAFHGTFSIKDVLPAIVPGTGYDDLEIRDGDVASLTYEEMIDPGTTKARAASLRKQLLAYCKRDTEGMLKLYETFRG